MSDLIRDNGAPDQNLGLSAKAPDVQFVDNRSGGLSAADFARRDPLSAGHMRRSPGDHVGSDSVTAYFNSDKGASPDDEASMGASQLGPGILPTPGRMENYAPVRASDFARGFSENVPGQQAPSPGSPEMRGPIPASEAFGLGGGRERGDLLQADGHPSAMRGNEFPTTAGRETSANGDDARHQIVRPVIDDSPSLGGDVSYGADIGKHQVIKESER